MSARNYCINQARNQGCPINENQDLSFAYIADFNHSYVVVVVVVVVCTVLHCTALAACRAFLRLY